MSHREDLPADGTTPPGEEALDSDRADEEAAAIAAERIRSGEADESEDGTEALERLGIRVSGDGDE